MLALTSGKQIRVYLEPIDFRYGIHGLICLLIQELKEDPKTGDYFIFTNKRKDRVKILFWDNSGFVLYYKQLAQGRFCYSKYLEGNEILINEIQLKALLRGLDFHRFMEDAYDDMKDFL